MAKYQKTGLLPVQPGSKTYGDFTGVESFQDAYNRVLESQASFLKLPSALRKKFDNDPGKLLAFLENDENRAKAIEYGLIDKPVVVAEPAEVPVEG